MFAKDLKLSKFFVKNTFFIENEAKSYGGVFYFENVGEINISQCFMYKNSAEFGGVLYHVDNGNNIMNLEIII